MDYVDEGSSLPVTDTVSHVHIISAGDNMHVNLDCVCKWGPGAKTMLKQSRKITANYLWKWWGKGIKSWRTLSNLRFHDEALHLDVLRKAVLWINTLATASKRRAGTGQLMSLPSRWVAVDLPVIFLLDYGVNENQCQNPIQDNSQNFQRHKGGVKIQPSCISLAILFP